MKPQTIHRITQEIRHERAAVTVEETWAQSLSVSEIRDEIFRYIVFRRWMLRLKELLIADHDEWKQDREGQDPRQRFWSAVRKVAEHQLATK